MTNLASLTISEAGTEFRSGHLTPLDLTQQYLRRIEALDPTLNSYITVTSEDALASARRATRELADGLDRGPLHGIPIAHKDLIATAGVRTTSSSRIHAERVPTQDATVVSKLADAGSIMLGKLNMLECAYGVVHPDYGPALNPWRLTHSSGGSSSGSGVAVASGLCLAALGTDTGGSIRNPASWCGVVGHKPTYGLVSRAGVDPLSWSLDFVGPMTRTARDAALLLEGIAGYDPHDPGSAPIAQFQAADLDTVDCTRLRVGVPQALLETGVDNEVRRIVEDALEKLARVVLSIEPVVIDCIDDMIATESIILFAEAAAYHQPWLRTRSHDYAALTRDRLEAGAVIPAVHYINAQRARRDIIASLDRIHEQFDLLALPAMPTRAMRLDDDSLNINGQLVDVFRGLMRYSGLFNVTGAPAISIPCDVGDDGLPVGLQLAGRAFEDHVVLAAAEAFEKVNNTQLTFPTDVPGSDSNVRPTFEAQ